MLEDKVKTLIARDNQGIVLVVVIMIVALLLSLTGTGLLFSSLNLRTVSNIKTGSGAIHVADAGIQHALVLIPTGADFDQLLTLTPAISGYSCVNSSGTPGACDGVNFKPTLTGSLSGYTYSVVVDNDTTVVGETATNDTNKIVTLTSTATGPNSSQRKIRAYIGRELTNSWTPPGSIYVPGAANTVEFTVESGSTISGNDTNVDGTAGPLAAVPGIATSDADATTGAIAGIQTASDVTGAGGTPSVATSSSTLDISALANSFLTNPHTTLSAGTYENYTFGTWASPQITYITGGEGRFRGSSSGAGVLIVDGKLRLEDTFNFKGLIILRNGGELRLETGGNAPIYGTILIAPGSADADAELDWRGGAIKYSSEAINKVNNTWPGALPQKAKVIAWNEVMQ